MSDKTEVMTAVEVEQLQPSPGGAYLLGGNVGHLIKSHEALRRERDALAAKLAALAGCAEEMLDYARSMDAECLCDDTPDDSICPMCETRASLAQAKGDPKP